MMDWSDHGGGYLREYEDTTPSGKSGSKSATRQQFLCPVTVRQVLEGTGDNMKVGNVTVTMVTLVGIVVNVDVTSVKVKFTLSDDTGAIECVEWLEADENGKSSVTQVCENTYYQVYGCIKTVQEQRRIMVFSVRPIQSFNEVTAFYAEVISFYQFAERTGQGSTDVISSENNYNSFKNSSNNDNKTHFNPIQMAILDEIKGVEDEIGWSRKNSALNHRFSKKQIDDAVDFLVSEGHIYSTVDDDHYSST